MESYAPQKKRPHGLFFCGAMLLSNPRPRADTPCQGDAAFTSFSAGGSAASMFCNISLTLHRDA